MPEITPENLNDVTICISILLFLIFGAALWIVGDFVKNRPGGLTFVFMMGYAAFPILAMTVLLVNIHIGRSPFEEKVVGRVESIIWSPPTVVSDRNVRFLVEGFPEGEKGQDVLLVQRLSGETEICLETCLSVLAVYQAGSESSAAEILKESY